MDVLPSEFSESLRVVIVSDTHTYQQDEEMKPMPLGDVLIHAGDFSRDGHQEQLTQFKCWFNSHPHNHKIFIAGNHDVTLDKEYYISTGARRFQKVLSKQSGFDPAVYSNECRAVVCGPGSIYLEDNSLIIASPIGTQGITIYGSPWQPKFCDWAFNAHRGEQLRNIWLMIPTETDVLVTHGPPMGILDKSGDGKEFGCADLLREIHERDKPPRLHIFGHIHESYGESAHNMA